MKQIPLTLVVNDYTGWLVFFGVLLFGLLLFIILKKHL